MCGASVAPPSGLSQNNLLLAEMSVADAQAFTESPVVRAVPVISGGASRPSSAEHGRREVGRARRPPRSRCDASVRTSGTGFVVCAVCGLTPSSSSIFSALPWSAVTRQTPPGAWVASTTLAEARVGGLDRAHDGGDHAGVADHVRVREVDDAERVPALASSAQTRRRPRRRTSRACGRSSARHGARARGSASLPPTAPRARR